MSYDFHWLLVAKNLLTTKLHSRYDKEPESVSECLERSDILPSTTQPWFWNNVNYPNHFVITTFLLCACNYKESISFNCLWRNFGKIRKQYSITVYWKKSFLSTKSDTKILQSIYLAYKVGIISSYSNRNSISTVLPLTRFEVSTVLPFTRFVSWCVRTMCSTKTYMTIRTILFRQKLFSSGFHVVTFIEFLWV